MSNTFLAEDFRLLLDMMQDITEADDKAEKDASSVDDLMTDKKDNGNNDEDSEDDAEHQHIDDLLQSDRTEDLTKESVTDVMGLIEYLDQFSELKDYRDQSAEYDDAYYSNVPLDEMTRITGLSEEDLHRIDTDTDVYEGTIWLHDNKVDIFGSD